jgi:hypothetical protein
MIKVLDCTFRDGGYYNDWKFNDSLVDKYIAAITIKLSFGRHKTHINHNRSRGDGGVSIDSVDTTIDFINDRV